MKPFYASIVIIAFATIATGGFLAMSHDAHQHGCIAETATGAICPNNDIFASANFLLNAFKSFSTANLISGMLLAIFLTLAFSGIFDALKESGRRSHFPSYEQNSRALSFPLKLQLAHMLALHEKRDPAVLV